VGEPDAAADTLARFEAERTWTGAAVRVQNDRAEPCSLTGVQAKQCISFFSPARGYTGG